MTQQTDIKEVQAQQQVAIDNRDTVRANELYAEELALRSELVGLGQEQIEDAPQRSFLTPKPSETSPGDYLLHSGLISTDDANVLGELVDDEDVVTLADIVGAATKEMISTNRRMAVDAVASQERVDSFLDGFSRQEKAQLTASVISLPRALVLASRFLKVARKKNPYLSVPDDFRFWLVALPLMDRIFYKLNRARPEDGKIEMSSEEQDSRDDYLDNLDAFHERIAELQAQGRHRDANRIYQREQRWLARVQGDQRIVGSSGRTA